MKKSFILILAVLLIIPVISAVQIDMKSNFSQDETLIARVSGSFLGNIQEQNVLLYEGHIRIPFIPYVQEINNLFYIYGQLAGKDLGNYSLVITGVDYFESGETKNEDIIENFTVSQNQADFSVAPGFFETEDDFSIIAQSFTDTTLTVTSSIKTSTEPETSGGFFGSLFGGGSSSTEKKETQILPGQSKQISFSLDNSYNNELIYAVLETENTRYEIPVFVKGNATEELPKPAFGFQPDQRNISIGTNSSTFVYIYLYNSGTIDITNVSLFASSVIKPFVILPNQTFSLNANSSRQIRVNISSKNNDGLFEGIITAESENLTSDFILILNFSKSFVPSSGSLFKSCSELSGSFCNENQTCKTNDIREAVDGACCIGGCKPISSNSGKIVGGVLAGLIALLVIVFFVLKYLKAKKPFNLLDFAKKK